MDVSDSRLAFGIGEFLAATAAAAATAVVVVARCVGDTFGVDIGIDELLRLVLFNDKSLRRLCADSGRYKFGDVEFGVFCIKFDATVGDAIVTVSYRPFKLPVLLFKLLLDGGPDGLREFTKLRPVGGFGAK